MSFQDLHRLVFGPLRFKTLIRNAANSARSLSRDNHSVQMEVVENLRSVLQEDPIVRLNDFKGIFAVDPRSDLFARVALSGEYEKNLISFISKHIDPSRDAIDVGANVGFYTVMLASTLNNRKILAVEPTSNALRNLHRNIKLNNIANKVYIYEGVVSDMKGQVKINTIIGKEEYSSLGFMSHNSIQGLDVVTQEVQSITLDELVDLKALDPGFLKVDVEGVEHLVFKGAQRILSGYRPIVLSELSDSLLRKNGSSAEDVINIFKHNSYDVFDSVSFSKVAKGKKYGDIVCFPHEMNYSP